MLDLHLNLLQKMPSTILNRSVHILKTCRFENGIIPAQLQMLNTNFKPFGFVKTRLFGVNPRSASASFAEDAIHDSELFDFDPQNPPL